MEDHSLSSNISMDNNSNNQTKYQQLGVPGSIIINNKTYIFKVKLKSEKETYTYRCKIFKYRVPIKINKENFG